MEDTIYDTPMGRFSFDPADDFLTKVRKAIMLSSKVEFDHVGFCPVPMDPSSAADVALAELFAEMMVSRRDFLLKMIETYASEEDAVHFALYWGDREE